MQLYIGFITGVPFKAILSILGIVLIILATIVCPLALLVGAIGSIILIVKKKVKI